MEHVHGPNCGCKDYLGVENANDLLVSIDADKVHHHYWQGTMPQ